jgi:plasmid stability protein
MSVMVQIRNMPDALHRTLKARAALAGTSLSAYLLQELSHSAERPTLDEMRRRLAALAPINPQPSAAEVVRAERDARARHLLLLGEPPVRPKPPAVRSRGGHARRRARI